MFPCSVTLIYFCLQCTSVLVCLSIDVTGALVLCPTKASHFRHPHHSKPFLFCTCVSVHRRDRCTRTLLNQGPLAICIVYHRCTTEVQFSPKIFSPLLSCATQSPPPPFLSPRTCVSVHRRDRCTRTSLPLFFLFLFLSPSLSVPLSYWRVCP